MKQNLPDMLERQLSSPKWKGEVINLGGITDNYQPWEKEQHLMPEILKVLIKYRNPCVISTKSDLILRDFDLFDQLSRLTYVNIASTITCADEELAARLEPGAVSPARRFAMLKAFGKTDAVTGVHSMPIIPYLTDSYENLQALYEGAVDCGASYLLPGILYLRGRTREVFFDFVWKEYPDLLQDLNRLYENGEERKHYKQQIYGHIRALAGGYKMPSNYMVRTRIKMEAARQNENQLTFL